MKANRRKLQLAMANACLTSRQLAETTGMPRPSVNNVLCGRNVKPATIGRVAKALGVPVIEILEQEEEP